MQTKTRIPAVTVTPTEDTFEVILRVPIGLQFLVADVGDCALDVQKVHPDNLTRALIRGFYERFKDTAAVARQDAEGELIHPAEHKRIKYERLNDLAIHFESGTPEWGRRGTGDGSGSRSIIIEAFARVQGLSYDEASERVDARAAAMGRTRKAQLLKLSAAADIKRAVLAIRAERDEARPTAIDADDELAAMTQEG